MKQMVVLFCGLLVCILLMVFSSPVMEAARQGLSLFWHAVFPSLFPFFVATSVMERTGAVEKLCHIFAPLCQKLKISLYALPVFLIGCLAGYPTGARLSAMLLERDAITDRQAQRLGTICNLCSPMFLLGAVCIGMLGSTLPFFSICIGHYGSAALIGARLYLTGPLPSPPPKRNGSPIPFQKALPGAIGDGILGMLKVGGSIVFFLVLTEVLRQASVFSLLTVPLPQDSQLSIIIEGILCGMLEMTGGCRFLANAQLPLRLCTGLCSFLVSFGGLCVMLQAMTFLEYPKPTGYLGIKLLQGILSGGITYLIFPLLPGTIPVMAAVPSQYAVNAFSGLTMLLASLLSIAGIFLLSSIAKCMARSSKKRPAG